MRILKFFYKRKDEEEFSKRRRNVLQEERTLACAGKLTGFMMLLGKKEKCDWKKSEVAKERPEMSGKASF